MAGFNDMIIPGSKLGVEGSYVEEEVLMPKALKRGEIPALIGVEVEYPTPQLTNSDAQEYCGFHVSTKSEDALKDISDDAVIVADKQQYEVLTEVGVFIHDKVKRITLPAPIPITSAKVYIGFFMNIGVAHTFKYRLHLVPRYIAGVVQQNNLTANAQF